MRTAWLLTAVIAFAGAAAAQQRPLHSLRGHVTPITTVRYHPEGRFVATASLEREVYLWDLEERKLAARLAPTGRSVDGRATAPLLRQQRRVEALDFAPDGTLAVACDEPATQGTVRLWNVAERSVTRTLFSGAANLRAIAFSPDGKRLAAAMRDGSRADHKIALYNVETGELERDLRADRLSATLLAWADDGKRLVSAGGTVIHIWDTTSDAAPRMITTHKKPIQSLSVSPDGERFVAADASEEFRIWNLRSGRLDRAVKHEQKGVYAAAFTPDGSMIATGGEDSTIKFWNPRSGREIKDLWGHGDRVTGIAFSPDGKRLVSVSRDQNLSLWETPEDD